MLKLTFFVLFLSINVLAITQETAEQPRQKLRTLINVIKCGIPVIALVDTSRKWMRFLSSAANEEMIKQEIRTVVKAPFEVGGTICPVTGIVIKLTATLHPDAIEPAVEKDYSQFMQQLCNDCSDQSGKTRLTRMIPRMWKPWLSLCGATWIADAFYKKWAQIQRDKQHPEYVIKIHDN